MEENRPYPAYSLITITYLTLFAVLAVLVRRSKAAEEKPSGVDIALIGLATYRLSRLISYDRVTQYLRLPFIETGKGAENIEGTREEPKGTGLRLAIGQLLTCTYCSSVWAAMFNSALSLLFPRVARLFLLTMAGSGLAELLDPLFPLLSYLSGYLNKEEQIEEAALKQHSRELLRPDQPT